MLINDIKKMEKAGFKGFIKINELMLTECSDVPRKKGIYIVLNLNKSPKFMTKNVGGHFKGKNPTVTISLLKKSWINNALVIYIGQAGGGNSNATLNSRLKQYMKFGQGEPIGHWGGRYVWQLENHKNLVICWKPTLQEDPRKLESEMIKEFKSLYGKRPFANLRD